MPDSAELAAFVREHIPSVWALELLVLLRRDQARLWRPAELVSELRASAGLVADNLAAFRRGGLAVPERGRLWRYAPASPLMDELAARLEQAYRERPVATIGLIAHQSDPVQGLADAFKWRGDK